MSVPSSCHFGPGRLAARFVTSIADTLPAAYARYLVELVARWNVPPGKLLEGLPISLATLSDPEARMGVDEVEWLTARARELTGEEGLGVYLALQIPISAHGYIGFAAMSARTVGEAIELAVQYAPSRTGVFGLRLEVSGHKAALILEEYFDLRSARDLVVFALLGSIARVGRTLSGREQQGSLEFAFPEPSYFRRLSRMIPVSVRFAQPQNRIVFDREELEAPLPTHDPVALQLAREQCERELSRYGAAGAFLLRVRGAIPKRDGVCKLGEVARRLHVSERTLKRRLAAAGTSYFELVDEFRQTRAKQLLRDRSLSVDEIAGRLGYCDAAGFTRAFRRWTGTTPAAFRRALDPSLESKPPSHAPRPDR